MGIRDTSKFFGSAQADMILADARGGGRGGSGAFIEEMEREGQAQLVTSDRLPAKCGDHAPWLALGFTFGEPDKNDPMFMPATLPPGWSRKGSSHAMWSYIVDQQGRDRVSIFYKAAFYDRDAFMSLVALGWYVTKSVEHDEGPIIFDDEWATPEAVRAAMTEIRDSKLAEAADFRGYVADVNGRDEKNRANCAEIAAKREAVAAKYDAAMAALNESG